MFGTAKKYILFILIFLYLSNNAYCSTLTENEEEIKCPHSKNLTFSYYRFKLEDQKNPDLSLGYVFQGYDVDTFDEGDCHLYILPSLSPCIGIIAIYNEFTDEHKKNKPIFLAHKDHAVRYLSICEKMIEWIRKINRFDKSKIKVTLFTSVSLDYNQSQPILNGSHKEIYQNRSQNDELNYLENFLINKLNKTLKISLTKSNFQKFLSPVSEEIDYSDYNGADDTLLVTRDGRIFNTSIYHEELFPAKAVDFKMIKASFSSVPHAVANFIKTYRWLLAQIYLQTFPAEGNFHKYNSLHSKTEIFLVKPFSDMSSYSNEQSI